MAHVSQVDGFTRHAAARVQQRSIPPIVIDYILAEGECAPAGTGAERFTFGKQGWRRFQRVLGPMARHFDHYRQVYVIVAGGMVVTAAYAH